MAGSVKASTARPIHSTSPAQAGARPATSVRKNRKKSEVAASWMLTEWSPSA
jgi:hypothetical protein